MGIAFVGDIMLGRGVRSFVDHEGIDRLFSGVASVVGSRAIVANLECPLTDRSGVSQDGPPRFAAAPRYASALFDAGLRAVNLANNHILDSGFGGLEDTITALREAGIQRAGAGSNRKEALRPVVLGVGTKRVAIIGLSYRPVAGEQNPGVASVYDERILELIRASRSHVDFLVVMAHTGIEFLSYPLPRDQTAYRSFIEAGADLVVGGHPHCVQVMEEYQGKNIYYSLGDLLFDHHDDEVWNAFWKEGTNCDRYIQKGDRKEPQTSLIVTVDFEEDGVQVRHHPVRMENGPFPRALCDSETEAWSRQFDDRRNRFLHNPQLKERLQEIETDLLKRINRNL